MLTNQYHVVPAPGGGWKVRKRGALRASKHFETKADAISWGREISRYRRSELVIHNTDGTIEKKYFYRNDPLPPRDQK
jgi:hypothetical protein